MAEVLKMRKMNAVSELSAIASELEKKMNAETVCNIVKADDKAILLCLEQYYFRVGNYVAISILLTQELESQDAVLVGSGGGSGLSNFSWGANKSIATKAKRILMELGFAEAFSE